MDKLAKLEKTILDYYLARGYKIGVGNWSFKVEINSRWKSKHISIRFYENNQETLKYIQTSNTTKEMFDEAIKCFKNQLAKLTQNKLTIK